VESNLRKLWSAAGFYYKIGVKLDDGQTYYTYISLP
jgi:hypothetical protein